MQYIRDGRDREEIGEAWLDNYHQLRRPASPGITHEPTAPLLQLIHRPHPTIIIWYFNLMPPFQQMQPKFRIVLQSSGFSCCSYLIFSLVRSPEFVYLTSIDESGKLFCEHLFYLSISWFLSFFLYSLFAYPFPVRLKLNKGWLLVISSCRWSDKIIALD